MKTARRSRETRSRTAPVIKVRYAVVGVLTVAVGIAGPLLAVRKQVYLRDLAIHREQLTDSLAVKTQEIARLRSCARDLSSPGRIEHIAREQLKMVYPKSDQIVIVESRDAARHVRTAAGGGIFALIKRSFAQRRG